MVSETVNGVVVNSMEYVNSRVQLHYVRYT